MATAREVQRRLAFGLLASILALTVGCGGGGSGDVAGGGGSNNGGSGGNNPPPPPPPPPPPDDNAPPQVEGPSATIRWAASSGPVAGYRVFVSRNSGSFKLEVESAAPQADVTGAPGDLVRVRVAAFDALQNTGPLSPPSDPFQFVAAAPGSGGTDPGSDPGSDPGTPPSGGDSGSGGVASGGGTGGGTPPASDPSGDDEPQAPAHPGSDLSGDGKADLAWQSTDGTLVRVTSADLSQARVYSLPSGSWRLVAVGDFDGDTLPDLLFSGAGELALARGTALRAASGELTLETWSALAADASFATSGDFDGDGAADALVVADSGSSILLTGGGVWSMPALAADAVAGAGDANGDGHDDVFIYGGSGLSLWRMTTDGLLSTGSVPAPDGVAVEGIGDFDGNGAAEVALRTAPDSLALERAQSPFESWVESAPAGAALAGCADYDGDGTIDLVWQDAESLRIVASGGEQQVALDPASPWRLLHTCN